MWVRAGKYKVLLNIAPHRYSVIVYGSCSTIIAQGRDLAPQECFTVLPGGSRGSETRGSSAQGGLPLNVVAVSDSLIGPATGGSRPRGPAQGAQAMG